MTPNTVTVRFPADLYEQLPEPSLVRGEGRNAFIVQAVRNELNRIKAEKEMDND